MARDTGARRAASAGLHGRATVLADDVRLLTERSRRRGRRETRDHGPGQGYGRRAWRRAGVLVETRIEDATGTTWSGPRTTGAAEISRTTVASRIMFLATGAPEMNVFWLTTVTYVRFT